MTPKFLINQKKVIFESNFTIIKIIYYSKGLNFSFIFSNKPNNVPIAKRVISLYIFEVDDINLNTALIINI